MIHCQLMKHLLVQGIVSDQQHGYIPNRSTSDAILGLLHTLYDAANRGLCSAVIFVDLKKAFNTINHTNLLEKLKGCGVDDDGVRWFREYLHQRQECTMANGTTSDPLTQEYGVPQGSVLGPLLFITYINNVESVISHGESFLYTDDLEVVVSGKDPARVRSLLQADLNSIGKWCAANKLTVNSKKTQILWSYSSSSSSNFY